ncbi:MAG: hypothetical protein KME54_08470 [Tolypothrix brevis GSE-NOS-MK-07-07A]|nr:hypothetical protein [Tolypothrix brevis GSE-NOS-MK-07-07A]
MRRFSRFEEVKYPSLPSAEKVALQFQLAQRRSYSSLGFPISSAIATLGTSEEVEN